MQGVLGASALFVLMGFAAPVEGAPILVPDGPSEVGERPQGEDLFADYPSTAAAAKRFADLRSAVDARMPSVAVARVELVLRREARGLEPAAHGALRTLLDRALAGAIDALLPAHHVGPAAGVEQVVTVALADPLYVRTRDRLRGADSTATPAQTDVTLAELQTDYAVEVLARLLRSRAAELEALERVAGAFYGRAPGGRPTGFDALFEEIARSGLVARPRMDLLHRMIVGVAVKDVDPDEPGDDLLRGRGRYPDDEYELEAWALGAELGWGAEPTARLMRLGRTLGRRERRTSVRRSRFGSSYLTRSLVDPGANALWVAYVEWLRAQYGGDADPGPARADGAALQRARVALLSRVLVDTVDLTPEQRAAIEEAIEAYVEYESTSRPQAVLLVETSEILRDLEFVAGAHPRRGSLSRRRFVEALEAALEPVQLTALALR